jgi:hypothetical protein
VRLDRRVGLARRSDHGRRQIDRDDLVAERLHVPREPPLAAAEVQRAATRRRQELEELVAVEEPVAVVVRLPRPGHEVRRVLLPRSGEVGGLETPSLERAIGRRL